MAGGLPPMSPEQLANMPVMPNPNGDPPNFVNPETNAPEAIAVMSIFLALASFAVILRMWSRISILKRVGLDDITAVISLVCSAATVAVIIYLLEIKVMGPHSWNVRLVDFMKPSAPGSLLAIQIVSNLANFFVKMSILLFVQRIFPRTVSPKTAYAIWLGIGVNVIAYVFLTAYICGICIPRPGAHGVIPAQCDGDFQSRLGTVSAAVNAALDCYVLAVSLPSLWVLQMPMRKKISIVGVLSVGLAACGLSLATLVKRATNDPKDDPLRNQVFMLVLAVLEPLVAIITACLPAMPALWAEISAKGGESFRRFWSKVGSTTNFSRKSQRSTDRSKSLDDESSMKSLQTHGMTQESDVEQGITVKQSYEVSSKQEQSSF